MDADAGADERRAARMLRVEQDILAHNDLLAARNRSRLAAQRIVALNLMSSPGAGKTTLLVRTLESLRGRRAASVIEGDQQTTMDAERIRATGTPAIQINTGKGCHLDANMVGDALGRLAPPPDSLLFIENVGNLVCPAAFDLGESARVVVLSVTEGDDKPLKYPDMFRTCTLMLINKVDLLPHVDFDVGRCIENARRVNAGLDVVRVSARSGEGMNDWFDWIDRHVQDCESTLVRQLQARVAELEARLAAGAG